MKKLLSKRILSIVLTLVMLIGMLPMTTFAAAPSEAETIPTSTSDTGKHAYSENLTVYYKHNNYLYKAVFSNIQNTDKAGLMYASNTNSSFMLNCDVRGRYLNKVANSYTANYGTTNDLPTSVGASLSLYSTAGMPWSKDDSKPVVVVTCVGVGEPEWTWNGTSAKAVFTSIDGNATITVNASVTSSTTPAANCLAKEKITYTAAATCNGQQYTDTKIVDGDVGPHSYTYSASENTLTEKCSKCSNHTATATLTAADTTYTGSPITTGASVTFSENWAGSQEHGDITYSNNVNVGEATAKVTVHNKELITTFEINEADIANATVVMSPESGTYTGTAYEPEISVVYNGVTLTEGTDYECSWDKAGLTNADSYTVTVTGKGSFEGTTTKTFSITQKEIAIEWSGTQFMPYTGQLVLPEALAIGLADGDTCEVVVSLVETTEGAGIDPGRWTAKITGLSNGNYKLPENSDVPLEVNYTIYANQTAPVVSGVDETINGKEDGHISGLTTEMEYVAEPSDYSGDYTRITDPNMSFAPGTYYVRYAAKAYYYASPYTEVIISAGDKLKLNVPETQKGYTLTADEEEVSWNGTSTLTFALSDGYSKIDSFAVKVNNETVTLDADGKYVISNIQQNQAITVEGVADITAPAAEIQLKENKWNQFLNHITFALFFNKTQDVTIIADDMGSGLDTIYYYLSDRELELDEVGAINDWQEYNGTFQINPENKYVIYAKAVDKDGNITYINSDGVVLDSIVPVISGIENDTTYYTTQKVTVTDDNLKTVTVNGNEVTGEIVLEGDEDATYTIVATDKAGNSTTVTVTMKPIKALAEATEHLSHDNVTSDDAPALEELIEKLDELIADPDTSEDGERETLEQHKEIAEDLLETIEQAAKAADTENTEKVKDVTAENVTPEDKSDLEKAKDDLEAALENNDGNYTEDEKKAIADEIKRIDDALEVIENVENVEDLIGKIPENITKNDEAAIKAAEKAYNALSDYEKSLVDKNVKKSLDDAKAALEKVKKPTENAESTESTSPSTGDNSKLWMWFALLFVSGGALAGINVYGRKKKSGIR